MLPEPIKPVLTPVPIEELAGVWPRVRGHVNAAAEKLGKALTSEELYYALRQNQASLYVTPGLSGILVLQIQVEPSGERTLWVWLAAGRMDKWKVEIHRELEALARSMGCRKLAQKSSRAAWQRLLGGYWKEASVVYEHYLDAADESRDAA